MGDDLKKIGGLLGVDLGLRMGLAYYDRGGALGWYRSAHVANRAALKRAAYTIARQSTPLAAIVVEGDRALASIWEREAKRHGARLLRVSPEQWRARLQRPRDLASSATAKARADALARLVIEAQGARRPTALRHDAAEAICVGLWGAIELGWLARAPWERGPGEASAPGGRRRGG